MYRGPVGVVWVRFRDDRRNGDGNWRHRPCGEQQHGYEERYAADVRSRKSAAQKAALLKAAPKKEAREKAALLKATPKKSRPVRFARSRQPVQVRPFCARKPCANVSGEPVNSFLGSRTITGNKPVCAEAVHCADPKLIITSAPRAHNDVLLEHRLNCHKSPAVYGFHEQSVRTGNPEPSRLPSQKDDTPVASRAIDSSHQGLNVPGGAGKPDDRCRRASVSPRNPMTR